MIKDFVGWHEVKSSLNARDHGPTFGQQEIWWCSIGVNVGHEADGKNALYNRPVLVIRKFNPHIFWGVALTTQIKDSPFYYPIYFKERKQCVMLSHFRLWESKRLTEKMGKISDPQFEGIKKALKEMIS